jgi:hypothetical protein
MRAPIKVINLCMAFSAILTLAGFGWFDSDALTGQIEIKRVPPQLIIEKIITIKTDKGASLEKQDATEVSFMVENTRPCQTNSNDNCYTRLIYRIAPSNDTSTILSTRIELVTDLDPAVAKVTDVTDALRDEIDLDLSTLKTRIEQNR